MQKRTSILPVGIFFILLSCAFFFLSQRSTVYIFFENVLLPVQQVLYNFVPSIDGGNKDKQNDKNIEKVQSVMQAGVLNKEIQALRDQFQTTNPDSQSLLPAKVIGLTGYIPGISRPTGMTINKGEADNVAPGLAVVYKDNLVGKVTQTTKHRSQIALLTKNDISFTARTLSDVNGLIRVESSELFLRNVLLSEAIKPSDIVVTKGDQNISGNGFPPDIIVGKVLSVDKKPSALFQSAKVQSMVDPLALRTVFIALPR